MTQTCLIPSYLYLEVRSLTTVYTEVKEKQPPSKQLTDLFLSGRVSWSDRQEVMTGTSCPHLALDIMNTALACCESGADAAPGGASLRTLVTCSFLHVAALFLQLNVLTPCEETHTGPLKRVCLLAV